MQLKARSRVEITAGSLKGYWALAPDWSSVADSPVGRADNQIRNCPEDKARIEKEQERKDLKEKKQAAKEAKEQATQGN